MKARLNAGERKIVMGGRTRVDVRHVQSWDKQTRPTRAGGKVGGRRRQIPSSGPGGCHFQFNLFHIQQVGGGGGPGGLCNWCGNGVNS